MGFNLMVLGLIFDIIGVIILTLVAIIDPRHQRIHGTKEWWIKYHWRGWRPIYRDTNTLEWKVKWSSWVPRYGFIPPKHQWNIVGLLWIFIGFFFQVRTYFA